MTEFVDVLRSLQSGPDNTAVTPPDAEPPEPSLSPLASGLVDLIVLVESGDSRLPGEVDSYMERALADQRPAWSAAARSLGALWSWRQGDDESALEAMVTAERELALESALPRQDPRGEPTGIGVASNNMGVLFLMMHLFELAQPHLERAAEESEHYAAPYHLQRLIDLANLAELHFRWSLEATACGHRNAAQEHARSCSAAAQDMAAEAVEHDWPAAEGFAETLQLAGLSLTDPHRIGTTQAQRLTEILDQGTMDGTGTLAVSLAVRARLCRLAGDPAGATAAATRASLLGVDDLMIDAAWREAAIAADPDGGPGVRYGEARSQRLERRRVAAVRDFRRRLSLAHLRRRNRTLTQRTERDPLTGVGNRLMLERLNADPDYAGAGLLLLDVDRFKVINDCYGHLAGDRVLEVVAHVAVTAVGDKGAVVRLGGDEFAVLVRGADATMLDRIGQTMVHGLLHGRGRTPDLPAATVSIGWSVNSTGGPPMELLPEADRAMYSAKHDGGSRVRPELPGIEPIRWSDCELCAAAQR